MTVSSHQSPITRLLALGQFHAYWLLEPLVPVGAEFSGIPSGPTCQAEFSEQPASHIAARTEIIMRRWPIRSFMDGKASKPFAS